MYRDADEILRERARAVADRVARQRAELSPEDVAALPESLQRELAELDARLACEELSPAALESAESALEERARLLVGVHKLLAEQHRHARRQRHDLALAQGVEDRRRRVRWVMYGVVVLLLGGQYAIERFRTDARCRRSVDCRVYGDCAASAGLGCVPASDSDCAHSARCALEGTCTRLRHTCVAMSDGDCARSDACRKDGLCTAAYHRCAAFSDADCARSAACASGHQCLASNGRCVREPQP